MSNQLYHERPQNHGEVIKHPQGVIKPYLSSLSTKQIKQIIGDIELNNTFADFVRNARNNGELK